MFGRLRIDLASVRVPTRFDVMNRIAVHVTQEVLHCSITSEMNGMMIGARARPHVLIHYYQLVFLNEYVFLFFIICFLWNYIFNLILEKIIKKMK